MKELLDKISSYNIFNFLLPGIVFVVAAAELVDYRPVAKEDIITTAFLYYFVGLVVSRFGSLVLEPILKLLRVIHFSKYKDFVAAEKKDSKLGILSEVNNTYRTFCSVFVLLLSLKCYIKLESRFHLLKDWSLGILASLLLILFVLSYRKQTAYITQRIKANE